MVYPVFPTMMIPGYRFISSLSWFAIANDSRFLSGLAISLGNYGAGSGPTGGTMAVGDPPGRWSLRRVRCHVPVTVGARFGIAGSLCRSAPSLAASAFTSGDGLLPAAAGICHMLAASLPLGPASGLEAGPSRCNWRRVGYRLGCRQPSASRLRPNVGGVRVEVRNHGQRCERLVVLVCGRRCREPFAARISPD